MLKATVADLGRLPVLETIDGADHSFHVLGHSGRADQQAMDQMLDALAVCAGGAGGAPPARSGLRLWVALEPPGVGLAGELLELLRRLHRRDGGRISRWLGQQRCRHHSIYQRAAFGLAGGKQFPERTYPRHGR